MVNGRASDVVPSSAPIAPVVKRKRRASCLGEQERRERKRAIDREAQRSLREKTKTHIAELERTIQILRDQDRNGATANLLSEIDTLRAENERLRDVIENVKSVIGCDVLRNGASTSAAAANDRGPEHSPAGSSVDQRSPRQREVSFVNDTKPGLPTPVELSDAFDCQDSIPVVNGPLDLDGMTIMTNPKLAAPAAPDSNPGLSLELATVTESPEHEAQELQWQDDAATAWWAPMMAEVFGPNWRSPSPIVLHIGNPDPSPSLTNAICPIWKKSNEVFGKVFQYHTSTGTGIVTHPQSDAAEAGLLFLGIKMGWYKMSNAWMQSPALQILKEVDELLFSNLPKAERVAVLYKSYKLLKYYLNATKEELDKVPEWLRPSRSQSSTRHPPSIDFFAWPTFRDRLVQNHAEIFKNGAMSIAYSQFVHFDWPFAFEDMFFCDERTGLHYPSPLFERYHRDLKYWTVDSQFYERFPEMMSDIEGDRRRFREVEG